MLEGPFVLFHHSRNILWVSKWLFEGRLRHSKNVLPDGLNWLCYFAGSSKSHHENSISFIFLESPHQVDLKNAVNSSKDFLGYFNTLETHSDMIMMNYKYINLFRGRRCRWPEKVDDFNFRQNWCWAPRMDNWRYHR